MFNGNVKCITTVLAEEIKLNLQEMQTLPTERDSDDILSVALTDEINSL